MRSSRDHPLRRQPQQPRATTGKNSWTDRHRAVVASYIFLFFLAVIVLRLAHIQLFTAGYLVKHVAPLVEPGARSYMARPGRILSRQHQVLAESLSSFSLVANPTRMREHGESYVGVAQELAAIIGVEWQTLHQKLVNHSDRRYIVLKRWLDLDDVARIREKKIKGVYLDSNYRRRYPHGRLACHTVGGRNKFHIPLFGIEHRYRIVLDGKEAVSASLTDRSGQPVPGQEDETLPPTPGKDIVLTLDLRLQKYIEGAMDRLMERAQPKAAYAVVLEPHGGDILAIASRPAYNPDYLASGRSPVDETTSFAEAARFGAVADQIDPGSTFKVLLAAAALESKVIDEDDTFRCDGQFNAGGKPINCWGRYATRGHGDVNLERMVAMSCNVAAAKTALKLGAEKYVAFLRQAGVGAAPKSGLPGETSGRLRSAKNMPRRDLASLGFGQGLSASPLQITAAIASLANEGRAIQPHVIASVLNRDGSVFWQPDLPEPQRLCSPEAARTVLRAMVSSVESGTAAVAKIEGVDIAAKTGTAQKWDPDNRQYFPDRHVTSFVLICPADAPRYVIFVAADDPKFGRHGSDVAGPTARDIASFALRQL
ncbi:MAG: peptidoglycan D,D-transpeptidase FtsI family protein [Armatimonadota bacterium]